MWHNTWKMHNINFKIVVFSVIEPCNLNCQLRWSGLDLLLLSSDVPCRQTKMFLQNIHKHVCTRLYGVLTQTTFWIVTTVSTSNPILIKNWTLVEMSQWENWFIEKQYMFSHSISYHIIFHQLYMLLYITSQKLRKQTINMHFTIRTTYVEFQTSTTIIPQRNLTSDHEIKQRIWQWKYKWDCSRSGVPYVILVTWMTVATTQNEAQLFHWCVVIYWHNPTAPWCACLILARFLQL
jgi:hypothetical protein